MEGYNALALGVAAFITGLFLGMLSEKRRRFPTGKLNYLIDLNILNSNKLDSIMAADQEILAALAEADAATNEIAEDIAALVAREPNLSQETKDALAAHVAKLKGVASQYTPEGTGGGEGEEPVV